MPRWILVFLVVLPLVGSVPSAGVSADESKPLKEEYYELQKLLVDTLDQVERNYVKDISRRELVEAAIKGILNELDPYSAYISPKELDQFRSTVDGNFGGVGLQIVIDNGRLKVLSPLVGTPAYRAGIMAGDEIVKINGESTKGITLDKAVGQLKGQEGSDVTLTVIHAGKSEEETITVTREVIRVKTVLGDHRKEDDYWDYILDPQKQIGYIRITAFSRDTARELREALDQLKKDNLRGLILDLRFNPGGLLSAAIEVSDLFVPTGRIVSTKGRGPESSERTWDAHQEGTFEGFRMVVLVNRYTASAGEIVSACLQDHKRAIIMGERTWGKGSVQNVIPMEEGRSALKLTTATYYRPSGQNIHRFPGSDEGQQWGVKPDDGYELKLTDEEIVALVRDRHQRDVVQPKPPKPAKTGESDQQPPEEDAKQEPSPSQENADSGPSQSEESAEGDSSPANDGVPDQKDEPKAADDQGASMPEESKFVDPQLRMALDYLTGELARAD